MTEGMRPKDFRPSPALIVAMIALIAALAGSAVAAQKITKSKVKTIAAKQVNKLAPDLSVAKAKTADTAKSADTAGSADNVLWAVVSNGGGAADAAVARAGQAGTTVTESFPYFVNVDFGRPVTGCAWLVNVGAVANATPGPHPATTEGVGANPNAVQVRVREVGIAGYVSEPFHLRVIC